ncbi:MAG TPA: hypothetical protein VNX40_16525 [Mucilaginibacter sp.]|jgi:hypothetical protein|nr:hypothetical protein [Mucilaginibacter sp.]
MEKKVTIIKSAVQEKANTGKQQPIATIASAKDLEIVFEAIVNPPGPNQSLRNAAEVYKLFIQDNK